VLLQALADTGKDADTLQMIDGTIMRALNCSAGAKGGLGSKLLAAREVAFSTKIHARANALGLPIGLYALRARIECLFNKLKNHRRIATRYGVAPPVMQAILEASMSGEAGSKGAPGDGAQGNCGAPEGDTDSVASFPECTVAELPLFQTIRLMGRSTA